MTNSASFLTREMQSVASYNMAKKNQNLPDGHDEEDYDPDDNYYSVEEDEEGSPGADDEPEFDNLDDFDDDFYDDDDDDF